MRSNGLIKQNIESSRNFENSSKNANGCEIEPF